MPLVPPLDGRLTSQTELDLPLQGDELFWIVSPGNAQFGNTYKVQLGTLAQYFSGFSGANAIVVVAGADSLSPLAVPTTATRVLFNKIVGAPSFATLPLAADMAYANGVIFKDVKGDATTNPITISFTNGELCDGQSSVTISSDYGVVIINPLPGGGAWYQT